jgi:hypothetical protein
VEARRHSKRDRVLRVLPWVSALVLVAGVVVFAGTYFTGDSSEKKAAAPANPAPRPAHRTTAGKPVFDASARKIARAFISTAVARKNLDASWPLLHADIKQGMTLAQWQTGEIPVVPYPVGDIEKTQFRVDEAYEDSLLLEVALMPERGAEVNPGVFHLGLRAVGNGTSRHWLVDYWMPRWSPPIPYAPG